MPKITISSFLKELWRHRLPRYSILTGIVLLLIFFAMPIASKYFLKQWLLNNGADRATIGKIRINPFEGRLNLANVSVKRHGKTVLSNSTIYIDLGIQALFDREALLQRANLTDTTIDIKRYEDGSLRIGSYLTSQEKHPQKEEEGLPWVFRARQVVFSDVLIHYSQSDLDLNLLIEQATLKMFTTDPQGKSGSFDLAGTLNDAPVKLQLSMVKINPKLHLEGKLQVSDFQLAQLAGIFKEQLAMFQGSLRADTSLVVKQNETGMEVAFSGEIAFADLDVRAEDWAGSGSLALDGKLGYTSLQTGENRIIVDGLLLARPLFFTMPNKQLRLEEPALTLKGKTTIDLGDELHAESDAALTLKDASFKLADLTVASGHGTWTGRVDYSSGKAGESMSLTTDGGIDLQNLTLSRPGTLMLRQQQLKTQGVTKVRSADWLKVGYQGSISLIKTGLEMESLSLAGDFGYEGGIGYTSEQSEKGNNITVDGRLVVEPFSLTIPEQELSLRQSSLTLHGKTSIDYGEAVMVNSDAALSLAKTAFKRADLAMQAGSGSWAGTVDYNSGKVDKPLQLKADGAMDLQDFVLSLPGTVELRQGHVALQGNAGILSADPFKSHYKGSISLTDTGLDTELLSLDSKKLLWQGDGGYTAGTDGLQKTVQLEGSLKALEAQLDFPENNLQTAVGSFSMQSDSKISLGGEEFGYDGTTALQITDLLVAGEENTLATIANISVERIRGNGKEMVVDKLTINNTQVTDKAEDARYNMLAHLGTVTFLEGTIQDLTEVEAGSLRIDNGVFFSAHTDNNEKDSEPLITLGSAGASPLHWSREKGTLIGKVELNNLSARYRTETVQSEAKPAQEKAQSSKDGSSIPLKIGQISVGDNSALYYTDTTTDPAFHADIAIKTLTMSNIDLNQPQEPVPFELEATINKYAPLAVTGHFAPLASPFSLKQSATLQNYSLQTLSPYVIKAVGLDFVSGQLDLSSELSITGEKISADNKLTIKNIEIAKRDEERSRELEKNLPVPIGLAVDMLRDRQGKIFLSVPVNGTLSDLQVGIQNIVVTAVTKAIIKGIAPALAYTALGPGGALAYLGMEIGRSLFSSDMPTLEYAPNASMLTNQQKTTLIQIGQRLEQKMADQAKTYSICPKVVPGETGSGGSSLSDEERRRELYRLGEKRAQEVKSFLLENFKIDKDRLFICNPTLNYGESAHGSVIIRE